jgi:hypothetical protein
MDFVAHVELNDGSLTASGQAPGVKNWTGQGYYCRTGSAALSRPATSADYEYKKICYDVGQIETYGPAGHPGKAVNDHWGEFTWESIDDKGTFKYTWPNVGTDSVFLGHNVINDDGTLTASGPVPGLDNWSGDAHYCRPGEEGTAPK